MFAPFNPFRCFVPNQFEPAATVAINRHSKQALAYETNQSAGKIDRQQDAEDLQNGERLLIKVLQYEQVLPKQCSRGGMIGDQVNRECGLGYAVDDPAAEGKPVEQ